MLQDYINDYCDACEARDRQKMRQIEGILFKLGMDRTTLIILANEVLKERRANNDK